MTLRNHNLNQIILCKRARMDLLRWIEKYASLYRRQNLKLIFKENKPNIPK